VNTKNQIIEIGRTTIRQEISTLEEVWRQLSDDFYDAVTAIYACTGRVIVTGMGKSAIIGQKIVATLNSTGTPSAFMHAADAAHGDLGILNAEDILLLISKSGETDEIKVLLPLVINKHIKTIAFVSRLKSFLHKNADISVYIPVQEEADPHNLAPTSSTTAQLAVGDALAVALLSQRGFTVEQFAILHPGGSLGKKLTLKVKDLSGRHEKPSVGPDALLKETILEMTSKRLGTTAVESADGTLLGIITDGDIRRMLESNKDITQLKAKDIMSSQPKLIKENDKAFHALQLMEKLSITQLLVVDEKNTYTGVVHIHDILREGLV
jgi:arabinose-5-phosphate isomerase